MVVAVFVLCLALGSLAVSALPRIPRTLVVGSQWALVGLLFPLYFAAADVTYWAHLIRIRLGGLDAGFFEYQRVIFLLTLAVLAIPIGLSGALLPLLFHQLRREVRDLGSVAGRLYAWNTVGSLLGALLGGYLLLFWIDLHHVYRICMAPIDHLSIGLFRTRKATPLTFVGPDEFFERRSRPEVIFHDDDPISTVTVGRPQGKPENLGLYVNGKPDGALVGDYPTMSLTALIPALLAEQHNRAFVIGLGTGVTAGELAALDATQQVVVAEISRGVIAANPLFDAGNLGTSKHPRIELIRGDAYRTLLRSSGRYDVIVSEPSNPWVAGVEMLYSREVACTASGSISTRPTTRSWSWCSAPMHRCSPTCRSGSRSGRTCCCWASTGPSAPSTFARWRRAFSSRTSPAHSPASGSNASRSCSPTS
jgi:spermidine synthase